MSKIKDLGRRLKDMIPIGPYCAIVNVKNVLKGRAYRLSVVGDEGLHRVDDGSDTITICRRGRHRRYKRGVMAGVHSLARQYHLDKAEVMPGGVLIDCGANVGELGLWASKMGMSYLPVEPEKLEADCVDLNNFDGQPKTRRMVLWKEDTTLRFFSKPGTADSSVFDMGADDAIEVEAKMLDSLNALDGSSGTNIFKLEAEGAEPEVLEGALNTLKGIDYVAVDCGYERGTSQDHTFIEVNRALSAAGFEAVEAGFHRVTILYRRKQG